MKNAIILFVRHPKIGKVKTRLAKDIGDVQALKVYKELLAHTHTVTNDLACDKFVFYADSIITDDIWEKESYVKCVQVGGTLGERMKNAFSGLFSIGYHKVIIIGSDCPGLTPIVVNSAFKFLDTADVVIGPATDGGYYLLALNYMIAPVFENKKWSTDTVLTDTLADLQTLGVSYLFTPVLQDIDTKEDLIQLSYTLPE